MASEIYRERVYGNFKAHGLRKPKAKQSGFRAKREGMDAEHAANIRKLPCACCLKIPSQIHHLKNLTGERGASIRSTDRYGVPLCENCHLNGVERAGTKNEHKWFADNCGLDPIELANALWSNRGDVAKMTKVVIAHRKVGK